MCSDYTGYSYISHLDLYVEHIDGAAVGFCNDNEKKTCSTCARVECSVLQIGGIIVELSEYEWIFRMKSSQRVSLN